MIGDKSVLAIIPARSGSKSIPGKNIRLLGGKPLIWYTIRAALKSKYVDKVIVSTNDKKIAEIAKKSGAETPFLRPEELARDDSSSLSVIIHALKELEEKEGYTPDIVVFLQPTSPFRKAKHIDEGVEKIRSCDGVIGICEVKEHPYFMFQAKNNFLIPYQKIKNRPLRRQDTPKLYRTNASLNIAKIEYYDNISDPQPATPMFEGKVRGVFMDEISSIDIDNETDFLLAEKIIEQKLFKPD